MIFNCTVSHADDKYDAEFEIDDRDQADMIEIDGMTREAAAHQFGWTAILDMEEQAQDQWHEGGRADALMAEREFRA